jgi:lipoate-protein ligase A
MESYRVIHEAVMDAVRDLGTAASLAEADMGDHTKATLQCFVSPTLHDILGESGKLAGAAQRRGHSGILHQGSISNEAAHGHSREEFIDAVAQAFINRFDLVYEPLIHEEDFLDRAAELADRKYASDDWNLERIVPEASRI